ncbi:MAG: hypothetical protein LBG49_03310, partial [Mycoplasmataceae bacterium]|nr:hypothetical protein [Mycoplasmataceae bacterium]
MKYRIEKDSFGEIKVDDANYWGAQTQRSLMNFNISKETMPLDIIHAIAGIKLCAAKTNADCKKMDKKFLIP